MKKNLCIKTLIALFLCAVLLLCGCSTGQTITLSGAYINEAGELVISYSDGSEQILGVVVGEDGKDGTNGIDGIDGKDGVDGKDGKDGVDGKDGKDGINGADGIDGVHFGDSEVNTSEATVRGLRSTVSIVSSFVKEGETEPYHSAGSGVIYQMNREAGSAFVITNHHVVYDEESSGEGGISTDISLYLYGGELTGKEIKASYVGGSAYYDLAVLYVEDSDLLRQSMATAVEIADSDLVMPGDIAIAVGNPQGSGLAVSDGVISVDSERITLSGSEDSLRVLRVDTPINKGNSGGGLYNEKGQLIGIVNAKIISSTVENIGYAIPSSVVVAVADNIIDHCFDTDVSCVMRPLVGITITTGDTKGVYDSTTGRIQIVETVTVYDVSKTSAFYGKLQIGDVLVSIRIQDQEKLITRQHHILDYMLTARVGDTVSFTVLRDGVEHTYEMTLSADQIMPY